MVFFKLFIAGNVPKSEQVIRNLEKIFKEVLDDQFRLEVFDIFKNSIEVEKAFIFATPTLVKTAPDPERRILGDLSDKDKVLCALGLVLKD